MPPSPLPPCDHLGPFCAYAVRSASNSASFHLAVPVHEIEAARHFYGEVLGFPRGHSDERWTDWNMEGHQVVIHQVDEHRAAVAGTNPVDGHEVPVPTSAWCSASTASNISPSG